MAAAPLPWQVHLATLVPSHFSLANVSSLARWATEVTKFYQTVHKIQPLDSFGFWEGSYFLGGVIPTVALGNSLTGSLSSLAAGEEG